ncbi:MAG TPA: protein jag [Syntrophobacteraceae bacterium]|nr:protein jag [Syntrophobacteraceae bacterium]
MHWPRPVWKMSGGNMSTMEFEEKTIEEAIALACQSLGLPRESLEIEVLSRESSGIFGIFGSKKAKIRVTPKEVPIQNTVQQAKDILTRILDYIEVPTVVEAESTDDQISLNIISNGSGLLIGKRGKTLQALQYLVSKILQREVGENVSVVVDTENYRSKRESGLVELAQQLSEKVRKSRRPFTTGPLNAHDRRVIHLALKDDQQVRTKSKGEGNLRKVVIYPIKKGKTQTKDQDQTKVEID